MNIDFKLLFSRYKFIAVLFILCFLTYIIMYYKSAICLHFDIPAMFLGMMLRDPNADFTSYNIFADVKIRFFSNFIVALPFNITTFFHKFDNILDYLRIFATSYLVIHFIGLILNFIIARRTKRYDIAILSLFVYTFFSLPAMIWLVRELHTAVLFYFMLLSYFLSKEKLKLIDIIPVILLITYLFESFETSLFFGIMLFIFAQLLTTKKEYTPNPWFKTLIGIGGLLASIYIIGKLIFLQFVGNVSGTGLSQWIQGSLSALKFFFNGNYIITFSFLVLMLASVRYKKSLSWKSIVLFVPFICAITYILYAKTAFWADPNIELNYYSQLLWVLYPILFIPCYFEYKDIDINKFNEYYIGNLFLISCICGILNLAWQINTCYNYEKYFKYLKNLMQTSQETIVHIPTKDFLYYKFLKFDTCFGTIHKSLFLSDTKEITKLLFPSKENSSYCEYCFEDNEYNYYDKNVDAVFIQGTRVHIKTNYWDLTPIKEYYEKENKIKE